MDERWRVLVVLTTARTAMGFQLQTVGSVAPALREALSIDDAGIGFLIGLFLLPGIAFALPSGIIGNRFGDKRIVLFGLALMVIGSSGFAMAPSYHAAVVARAVCGSGGVLLNVLLAKIVTELFSGREAVLAMESSSMPSRSASGSASSCSRGWRARGVGRRPSGAPPPWPQPRS